MLPTTTFTTTNDSYKNYAAVNTALSVVAGTAGYLCYGVPGAVAGASAWAITTVARAIFDHQLAKLNLKPWRDNGVGFGLATITGTVGGLYTTQLVGQLTKSYLFRATPFIKLLVTKPSLAGVKIVAKPALISAGLAVGTFVSIGLASNAWTWIKNKYSPQPSQAKLVVSGTNP